MNFKSVTAVLIWPTYCNYRKRKVEREHACMCPQQKVQIQQQSSSRSWRLSGFTVKKESSIALASQLCASVRMALIVWKTEENNFIETMK